MALPSSYLVSFKNVPSILGSIQSAQAPSRFTVKFLQDLGYTSSADRLFIKVLKTYGLLRESGEPTQAYHEFLDPSQSGRVLAEGLRQAYADLFQVNKNAHKMSLAEVRAKLKTISQGSYSDNVLGKMANTFIAFAKHADFDVEHNTEVPVDIDEGDIPEVPVTSTPANAVRDTARARLVYEVNIHLPATRDPAVYDALFSSLTKHLHL